MCQIDFQLTRANYENAPTLAFPASQIGFESHFLCADTSKTEWRRRDLNPGPLTCEASALPLSYVPDERKEWLRLCVVPDVKITHFFMKLSTTKAKMWKKNFSNGSKGRRPFTGPSFQLALWLSWQSACLVNRRSWVRIPVGPF